MALVEASVNQVWELLMEPARYDEWWDVHLLRVVPPGSAQPGQRIEHWTRQFGKRWNLSMEIQQVNPERHAIDLITSLPFGVRVQNHVVCTAMDESHCHVQFG
ncbi:MAG: hypothetical protein NVS4B8_07020 [Herpetosiphon sp.]